MIKNNLQNIQDLIYKKEEHIKKQTEWISYLANNKINQTFITGKCSICEKYDNEINENIKKIKN